MVVRGGEEERSGCEGRRGGEVRGVVVRGGEGSRGKMSGCERRRGGEEERRRGVVVRGGEEQR